MLFKYDSKAEEDKRQRILQKNNNNKKFRQDAVAQYNILSKIDPKFAKHIVQYNEMINRFMFQQYGNIDMLDQPICPHCQRVAMYDVDGCYCFACKSHFRYPPGEEMTLRKFLVEYVAKKGFNETELHMLNMLGANKEEIYEEGRVKRQGIKIIK